MLLKTFSKSLLETGGESLAMFLLSVRSSGWRATLDYFHLRRRATSSRHRFLGRQFSPSRRRRLFILPAPSPNEATTAGKTAVAGRRWREGGGGAMRPKGGGATETAAGDDVISGRAETVDFDSFTWRL
jgi:hypothetical protein